MRPKRVLLVDDSKDTVGFLRDALKYLDPTLWVTIVQSAEDALLEVIHHPADLLVVDVHLPGISGLELVKKIRAGNHSMKVVLISGLVDSDLPDRSRECGADVFIRKPVELGEFLATVDALMGLGKNMAALEKPALERLAEKPHEAPQNDTGPETDLLTEIRQRLSAAVVILLDANGKIVEQAGELPEIGALNGALPAILDSLKAGLKAGLSLGSTPPENVLALRGESFNLVAAAHGPERWLLVALKPAASMVRLAVAVEELFDAQRVSRPAAVVSAPAPRPAEPHPEPLHRPLEAKTQPAPPAAPAVPAAEEGADDLESLFKTGKPGLSSSQVDAFWENLLETKGNNAPTDTDSLSYDEAVRLGLTPKESQS